MKNPISIKVVHGIRRALRSHQRLVPSTMALIGTLRRSGNLLIKHKAAFHGAHWSSSLLNPFRSPSSSTPNCSIHTAADCMEGWAEWEAALDRSSNGCNASGLTDAHVLVAPTPHPAAASAAECSEWEAVLSAKDTATASPQQSRKALKETQPQVYAVIECGSHSTRLLLSTGHLDLVISQPPVRNALVPTLGFMHQPPQTVHQQQT